jgi:hypothetical protein
LIKIQTKSGSTKIFDLKENEEEMNEFLNQNEITSISILKNCNKRLRCEFCGSGLVVCKGCGNNIIDKRCNNTFTNVLLKPKGFRRESFFPEIIEENEKTNGGERIVILNDGIKTVLTVHKSQNSSVYSVSKYGNLRFNKNG